MHGTASLLYLACVALGCGASCTTTTILEHRTSPAPESDASVEVDAGAKNEAAPPATTSHAPCPVEESGTCRPLHPADLTVLARDTIHMPAGGLVLDDGTFLAFGSRWDDTRLVTAHVTGNAAAPVNVLPFEGVGDGTSVRSPSGGAVYFTGNASAARSLYRAQVAGDGAVSDPEPVELVGTTLVPAWPQTVALADGRIFMAFIQPQKTAFIAVSDASGKRFDVMPAPVTAGVLPQVLAHVGVTANGSWVLAHQVGDASGLVTSYVQMSTDDGTTWSKPASVQPGSTNVHDTFIVTRLDHGADLYYLHTGATGDLNVHRRTLHEDGTLGPEQIVTAPDTCHVEKPQPRRLPDGRLAITMAIRRSPKVYDLTYATLDGDAPP